MTTLKLDNIKLLNEEILNNSEYLRLKQELERLRSEEQKEVINIIRQLIDAFEIDPTLFAKGAKKPRKNITGVRWRNTVTGAEWSGRGRKPTSFIENRDQWVEVQPQNHNEAI